MNQAANDLLSDDIGAHNEPEEGVPTRPGNTTDVANEHQQERSSSSTCVHYDSHSLPHDSRYRFIAPMQKISIDWDEGSGSYVVSNDFSSVYGTGPASSSAHADYVRSLFDYVAKLEEREDHLAKGPRQELKELRRHIARRP